MEKRKGVLGAEHSDTLTIMNNLAFTWDILISKTARKASRLNRTVSSQNPLQVIRVDGSQRSPSKKLMSSFDACEEV
jgi:hypothetical protein